ncbi:restriction endonuclease subunit S [Pseudomonas taiwanensis]|uniref:restriction endonuclease subunit S n=1 Tax=Pseudomonas taiwanensis TaxID=470150 RepID=UPI0015BB6C68|nr:restriction endonuclease subunit S [Pseudomonas taiwanensis]NWL79560.1 restriction endonuclease subunit S [Pseudomonas taiwanensis]
MTKYGAYPAYKPSNVAWLGDIPGHWDVWKVTHGFNRIGSGTTPKSDNPVFYDGNVPWVTTSELRETIITDTTQKVTEEAVASYSALKIYPKGSLAIAMYGATIGRLGMLGVDAAFNQACCVFAEPTVFDTRFVYYWLWMRRPILISLSNGGGQPNLSQDDLKKLWIPIPDIPEQQAIVRFLDFKTAQIDALIAKKKTLLDKLAEKRTALISHAVTKGLDQSAPMKRSGVEWIGDIPRHWTIRRVKFAAKLESGHTPSKQVPEYWEDCDIPWVSLNDSKQLAAVDYISETAIQINSLGLANSSARLLPANAVVFTRDATIGLCAITTRPMAVSQHLIAWIPGFEITALYLLRVFSAMKGFLDSFTFGATIKTIGMPDVKTLTMPLPPKGEQEAITTYIEEQFRAISPQFQAIETAIERLTEYRSALITAAVTGKIDVRGFETPQPPEGVTS